MPAPTAELRVRGYRRRFLATVCVIDGDWCHARGRWFHWTGPDHERRRLYSEESEYSWPARQITEVRWQRGLAA